MKKLLLSVTIASALGLVGCGSDSVSEIKDKTQQENGITQPLTRIVFDPANGVVPVPNDLLFSGTTDGTLNMPGEAVELGQQVDYSDPQTAIGALDGWSTTAPFVIDVAVAQGVTLDTSTAALPGAVRLFEATLGGALSPDSECNANPDVSACKIGRELAYGTEFVTMGSGNSIVIVPAMPLKASQGYLLAVTKVVKDSTNTSIAPSSTYESVRLDVATKPLPLPSQLQLQTLINSYEDKLEDAGVDVSEVVHSAVFTTQSTDDVLNAAKLLMLPEQNQPVIEPFMPHPFGATAGDILVASGLVEVGSAAHMSASRASVMVSKLHAPSYLETPTAQNCQVSSPSDISPATCPSLFSRFKAMGDSPITVLGALQAGLLPMAELVRQYDLQKAFFGRGDFTGDPAQLAGMNFTLGGQPLDSARHTTKFNPIPAVVNNPVEDTIDVLVSMPNLDVINLGRQMADKPLLEKPATGWPVMLYSHGITSTKETMLAFAGSMAEAGIAVISIDHLLHGSRAGAFSLPNGLTLPISASDVADTPVGPQPGDATAYLNLASLLTARDNLRQSVLDFLALRLSLNKAYNSVMLDINPQQVSFYGHSLGGITGLTFTASANTPVLPPEVSLNPYEIKASSLLAPGGGIPGFLLESPAFSGTVRAGLMSSGSFQAELIKAAAAQGIAAADLEAFKVAQPAQYQAIEDAVYAGFSQVFAFAAQTLVDSGDPVNYATTLAQNTNAIHLMEIVGNDTNLPDQVVPNNTSGSFLSGTDPLVALAGLSKVSATTMSETGVKAVVRFTDGHHSSMLSANPAMGGSSEEANLAVLVEMQTQLASFIASQGLVLPVTQTSVVEQ